jgi:hypothetical protein
MGEEVKKVVDADRSKAVSRRLVEQPSDADFSPTPDDVRAYEDVYVWEKRSANAKWDVIERTCDNPAG